MLYFKLHVNVGFMIIDRLVFRAGLHKMLIQIANRLDPDQTVRPDRGLNCLQQLSQTKS